MTVAMESQSCAVPAARRREIPFGRPLLGPAEKQAVLSVLDGPTLTQGPLVRQFEQEFAQWTGAEHALATSSCMAALHLACLALRIGPGDDVIVSAQTHVATAHAVELCGARCVFVDSEPRTGNVDPELIATAITRRTRAIAVVHYLGFPADIVRIAELARRRGLAVIEDCALALGATVGGRHVGLFGDAGCFSFYPAKHLTTGEGGMLITRRADLAAQVAALRAFGIERAACESPEPAGLYDAGALGLNYRMSEIAAALGVVQLRRLPEFLAARRRNYARLAAELSQVPGVRVLGGSRPVHESACYCLVLVLEDALARQRDRALRALRERGVGCSVYYPAPVPLMSYYREKYHTSRRAFPCAAWISEASIALPVGPHVSGDDIDYMVHCVREVIGELDSCAGRSPQVASR